MMTYNETLNHISKIDQISIIARELRAASFGALTQREAINQARAIVRASQ